MTSSGRNAVQRAAGQDGGVVLTRLGLGGAQLGNLYRPLADADADAMLRTAWDGGVRYVDTAPHYGLGLSERRLGAALAAYPSGAWVVSTKVGRLLVPDPGEAGHLDREGFAVPADFRRVWDFSRDGVRRSLEQSLERLGLDRVDVVYLHDPEHHWDQALRAALPALRELRDEGVVRAIGAGMNRVTPLLELVRDHEVDLVMCAGRHTLLERADELLDLAHDRGVGVVLAGVYASGLLARPRPDATSRYEYNPAPAALITRAQAVARVCEEHGTSLPAAALALGLRHPAVRSVVVGAEGPDQLAATLARSTCPVPDSLWAALHEMTDAQPWWARRPSDHPLTVAPAPDSGPVCPRADAFSACV